MKKISLLDFWTQRLDEVQQKTLIWNTKGENNTEGVGIYFADLFCGIWADHKKKLLWTVQRRPDHLLNIAPDGAFFDGEKWSYSEGVSILKRIHTVIKEQGDKAFIAQIPTYCDKGAYMIRSFKQGDLPDPEHLTRVYHVLSNGLKNHKSLIPLEHQDKAHEILSGIQPIFRRIEQMKPGWNPGG